MIEDFKVIENKKYGYKQVSPLPSREYLQNFYQKKYYDEAHHYYLDRVREQSEWLDLIHDFRLDLIENFIQGTGKLLEIGSGAGYFLATAASPSVFHSTEESCIEMET